jgi:MFS family permease
LTRPSATAGFAVFRERDFTLFLIARFFAQVAVQMMVIAVGWQVYHLTGRVLDLGLIGLSQFLPFLCLALFAGHAADVHERRVIIMGCLTAFLVCAVLLFSCARLAVASVWPIFGVLAMLGVARAPVTGDAVLRAQYRSSIRAWQRDRHQLLGQSSGHHRRAQHRRPHLRSRAVLACAEQWGAMGIRHGHPAPRDRRRPSLPAEEP